MASGIRKIMRAARYLKVGDEVRVPSSSGFSMVMATLQAKESGRRHFSRGTAYDLVVHRNGQEWKVYALGEDKFEVEKKHGAQPPMPPGTSRG
jgi:hypothetical protein